MAKKKIKHPEKVKGRQTENKNSVLPIETEKKSAPTVSVILSSYNHEKYVAQAIQSVLNQTFTDFELLIFDDGSTDNSREIIKTFTDSRIKTFLYEENRGPRMVLQDFIEQVTGKYVAVHHSDDSWTDDKLEKQVEFLENHSEYVACFAQADFIDEEGNLQQLDDQDFYKNVFNQPNRSRAEWLRHFFYKANCLCHPSLLILREVCIKYNLLEIQGLWQLPDYFMWIRLCFHANFYIMPEKLVHFRLRRKSQENMSASTFDKIVRSDTEFYFVAKEFIKQFTDDKFFLEVFPEAEKYLIDGEINRNFAYAQFCFEKNIAAWQLVGLEILKNLLSDEKSATQIKRLYNYDEKSFLLDTGKYDVFNLQQKFSMLNCEIYFDDSAEDFIFADRKIVYVEANGNFFAKFNLKTDKVLKFLRFDPDNKFTSIKIISCKINGKSFSPARNNATEIVDNFYRFLTNDSQFIFDVENLSGEFIFELNGTVEKDFSANLTKSAEKLVSENINIKSWGKDLENANKNLANRNDELQKWGKDLEEANKKLAYESSKIIERNDELQKWGADLEEANKKLAEKISALTLYNQTIQEKNDSLIGQNNELHRWALELESANTQLGGQNARLTEANRQLEEFRNVILNSNSWKITAPLRSLGRWVRFGNKDKALSIARVLYKAMPISEETKVEIKDKFYKNFEPFLKNTNRYKVWLATQNLKEYKQAQRIISTDPQHNKFFEMLESQPGKIAIHAHIFYLDLLEEIAQYFSNMPYKFDALISIIDDSAEDKVKEVFGNIENVENVIVRVVPNRGRDVAPFIIGFGDILSEYDFIAHVHSKKSLYTGSEQKKWRHYLFDSLLGSSERIKKIFSAFDKNKNVGLIYPRPAENVPYAAFTWLSNRPIGTYLLNKIGVPLNKTDYFDFPAGTMFWARTKGLRKFINNLALEDFPKEQGQNDGTIAHAFERAVALAVTSEKMDFYEFDPETETYTTNIGSKNMWQYYGRSDIELQWVLDHGEIISFDLFDTLIMRWLAVPYLVNELIKLKVDDLLGKEFNFPKFRLNAEEFARQRKKSDVTLDDIYESFADLTGLDEETCKKIRAIEVETEVDIILPREEMVSWFNRILEQKRKIWLISDMYLQTSDIEKILQKCGISGYEKLLISCETGMRKDTAAVWNNLVKQGFTNGKLVHLGDNEMSDVQLVGDRNISAYHVMSSINLFSQTSFGRMFLTNSDSKMSLYAGMLFGVILAEKFHNPFQLRNLGDGGGKLILKSFYDLGYWFYGVPLLTFMLWLIKKSKADNIQQILFLARDGYFLQPLYELITKLLKVEQLPNKYFYASRRAVTVASFHGISQTYDLLKLRFEGTVKKFFEVRFGIEVDDEKEILLPGEKNGNYLKKVIEQHSEEILSRAAEERNNYLNYIDSLGKQFDNVGVVDMGYSGTIQFYLQKVLQKSLKGYYFATSSANLFGAEAYEKICGCFTENDDYGKTQSAIYKYQLLFEAILTAPDAQLQYFDKEGKPVFGKPEPAQFQIEDIKQVHEGIKDFCRDVIEHFGAYLLRTEIDFDFVDNWVRSFVHDENIVAPEIRKIFSFDDEYCNTFTGNALDLYISGKI